MMSKYFYSGGKIAKKKRNGYSQLATNIKTHMRALRRTEKLEKELAELKDRFRCRKVDKEIEKLKAENKRLIEGISLALEDLDSAINEKFPYDEICCDIKYMFLELIGDSTKIRCAYQYRRVKDENRIQ